MALARTRRDSGMNYWPGFVDALTTLILSIIFLLTVFMVAQFFLSQEVAGKDTALARLNAQIARLSDLLSLERTGKANLEDEVAQFFLSQEVAGKDTALARLNAQIARLSDLLSLERAGKTSLADELVQLRASLAGAESERDRLRAAAGSGGATSTDTGKAEIGKLNTQIDIEKAATARAVAQIEILNQQIAALRRQIAALEEALGASEQKEKEAQIHITDLGQRLNVALAQRVQELSRYRSDFFGKLRDILGNRPDIRVVGDRFVFQSEVFFDSGQAVLRPEGRAELDKLAAALLDLEKQIPAEINWVLRVDGHTDVRPLSATSPFKSNWELSAERSISVVQYLIGKGVSPQRLVAAGFGEFQPIDPGTTDEAYSRNRRIELKLTEK